MHKRYFLPSTAALHQWLPGIVGISMLLLALAVLHHALKGLQFTDVQGHLLDIGLSHFLLALVLTVCSYLLLTLYDYLALKHVGASMRWRDVAPTSFSATAVGHNVGFATLSGGAIRYRAYSAAGIDATSIAGIILFCSATFFLGTGLLLGSALILEPESMLHTLPVPVVVVRFAGYAMLILAMLYIAWAWKPQIVISVAAWRFSAPSPRIALGQAVVGATDLALAAMVIYVILPADTSLSYLAFLGIYLLCLSIAVISNVPGGVGVFEGSMLLLLPSVPTGELIGSLLAFRVVYYLIPLSVALLVLAIQMLSERRSQVRAVVAQGSLILTRAAPQIIASTVFVAGAVMLISGSLPSQSERLRFVAEVLPDGIIQLSHLLGSVIGLALLILARGLYRRLEGAFWMTLILLGAGAVMSLSKGFDVEEALILCLAAALLWLGRTHFYRKAALLEEPFTAGWFSSIVLVIVGSVWLGFFAYRHVEYSHDLFWDFAAAQDAPKMLRASVVAVVLALLFALSRLLRTSTRVSELATDDDLQLASQIVLLGDNAEANVALTGDKRFLFHPENDAFIMYQLSGASVISMGDPVGNTDRFAELLWSYRELCDQLDKRCVFYQISRKHLALYIDMGLSFSKLGEEATIALQDFSLEGKKRAEFRQARNRAHRDGASFDIISREQVAPVLPELKRVSDDWLEKKHAREKGFSVGMFDEDYLQRFDVAVVRVNERIVAFANVWPSGDRSVLSIDLMRHSDAAPKGIMDYLFTELMLWGREQGYESFSLGMAPLSGLEHHPLASMWNKVGNLIFKFGDEFYNFEGLRHYKQKYSPDWQPRYLAAPGGLALPRVFVDATTLIAGGVKGVFGK